MTINDIAKLSNVSIATVSRVINNNGYVKKETRKKIEDIIKETSYSPNAMARGLSKNSSLIIAVIMSNKVMAFFTEILDVILTLASNEGFSVLFFNTFEDSIKEKNAILQAIEHRVAGIIILPVIEPTLETEQTLVLAEKSNIPVVLIDRELHKTEFDIVLIDNKKVIYEGVKFLINEGHSKIAIVTCPEVVKKGGTRYEGYKEALKDNGLPLNKDFVYNGAFDEKSGYKAFEKFYSLETPPTAVIIACSSATLGTMRYLSEFKLEPGKDIGVLAFDDIALLKLLGVEITSIERPTKEIGKIAFEILNENIKNKEISTVKKKILLETHMNIKGSEKSTKI
ncbi:MAG: LacI family DNA-binding transcriptional regulator [Lachnospirales bacterium]